MASVDELVPPNAIFAEFDALSYVVSNMDFEQAGARACLTARGTVTARSVLVQTGLSIYW